MRENWSAMPPLLKWLTAASLLVGLLFPVGTAVQGVRAYGELWTPWTWWSSGAGAVTAVLCALMAGAAMLMLRRARYARALYVLSLIASYVCVPLVARLLHAKFALSIGGLVPAVGTITLIIVYLAAAAEVRTYFQPNG